MDNRLEELHEEAARYRKWFEKVTINPFCYRLDGKDYYYAIFHKNSTVDFKGFGVISLENGPAEDYRKALFPLVLFSAASTNIFNIIGPRTKAKPEYFEEIIDIADRSHDQPSSVLIKGKESFEKQLNFQKELITAYMEYEHYYDHDILKRRFIKDEDIEYTLNMLATLDLLQFKQVTLLAEETMPEFFTELSKWKRDMSKDTWNFIRGLKDNRQELLEGLESFRLERSIIGLPESEQYERKKQDMEKNAEEFIKKKEPLLRGKAAQ